MPQWKLVHLEMAPTPQFPHGSASRTYILRVPLNADGFIDQVLLARAPAMATVRRFWPNEPDRRGRLAPYKGGWVLACGPAGEAGLAGCTMESQRFRLGGRIVLTEPDGTQVPFRVVRLESDQA